MLLLWVMLVAGLGGDEAAGSYCALIISDLGASYYIIDYPSCACFASVFLFWTEI